MLKRLILVLTVLALSVTACTNQTSTIEPVIIATDTQVVEETLPVVPTETLALPDETPGSAERLNTPVGCQTYTIIDAPTTDELSRFPDSLPGDWVRGPADAAVTIIEYGDFQCPNCAALEPILARLQEAHPEEIRIIFRHFPLVGFPNNPVHDKALLSAQAAEAAGRQGADQFWAMHDLLFAEQAAWTDLSSAEFENWLVEKADELELDVEQFSADLTSEELSVLAQYAWIEGVSKNLAGTPSLVINGRLMDGIPLTFSYLDTLTQLMLLEKRQYVTCPLITIDESKRYIATLETSKGDIVVELFADLAPLAVNNFIFLARDGFYNNVTFHRVLPNFMAQAGDPSGTGFGGPGYTFINEIVDGLTFDRAGLMAMANSGPDTNGSQFFITFGPAHHLDGDYTIFGQVISGMEVLEQVTPRNPDEGMNLPPGDLILTVTIEEK